MIKRDNFGRFICGSHSSSEITKGEHRSPKTEFEKNHILSKNTRIKMRQSKQGDKNSFWNKHHSEATRKKMRENHPDITGNKNPNWKGGKKKSDGYWWILKSNHPKAKASNYVKQSILVAEKCLGRYLTRLEVVHHINEIKDDDRPENLYLFAITGKHTQYHFSKNKLPLKSNLTQSYRANG